MTSHKRVWILIFLFAIFVAFCVSRAYGEMVSNAHAVNTTILVQSFTTSQKVLFNGAAGHVPHHRDYFGLFAAGTETRLQWCYLDGTKNLVTTRALTSGACVFEGLKPGNYAARVYAAGGTSLIDSTIFTVAPQYFEYRTLPEDGVVTFERTKESATIDRILVKRSANFNVDTYRLPTDIGVRQRDGAIAPPPAPSLKAAPKAAPRANP